MPQPLVASAAVRFAGSAEIRVAVADTPAAQHRGLMFRDSLGEVDGMLFRFERAARHAFWMRGVRFALDIIWIGADRVVWIEQDAQPCGAPPCPTYAPPAPATRVLEVEAGFTRAHGIRAGDRVEIVPFRAERG